MLRLLLLLLLWALKGMEGGHNPKKGYTLEMKTKMEVQEGLCVLVPCKFFYPVGNWHDSDPIHGYWFQVGAKTGHDSPVATNNPRRPALEGARGRFFLLGNLTKNDCSLNIREVRKGDSGSYFFRLERGKTKFNYLRNNLTLNVTALTDTPDIVIPETPVAGHPSNLTCSVPWACEWGTPPTFSWTGTSVSSLRTNTIGSSVLSILPQPQDHGTNLTCQVTLPGAGVTTRMAIRLNVSYAPKNLTVTIYQGADPEPTVLENSSSLPVSEGQSLRLYCNTHSYPPAILSWSWNNLSLCPSRPSKPGLLELFPLHAKQGGVYTCHAQNALGSQRVSLSLSLQSGETLSEMTMGAFVGAGATVLLFLSFCIIFLVVRSCRREPARPAVEAPDPNAFEGSVSPNPLVEPQADDSSESLPPTAEAAPSSIEEEEIHYASLSFHKMKPRNPQDQHSRTTTEYSEIKSHK